MTWHASADLLDAYVATSCGDAEAFSLERHLLTCGQCRAALAGRVDDPALARVRQSVAEVVDRPTIGWLEHLLRGCRLSDASARLVAATPVLRWSWFGALVACVLGAVVIAHAIGGSGEAVVFLLVAPTVPLFGVAVCFGPWFDPVHELGRAYPFPTSRLFLVRSGAVVGTSVAVLAAASPLLSGPSGRAWLWLLPCVALISCTLAACTWVRPPAAATAVATVWVAINTSGLVRSDAVDLVERLVVFDPSGQVAAGAIAVVALVVAIRLLPRLDRAAPVGGLGGMLP